MSRESESAFVPEDSVRERWDFSTREGLQEFTNRDSLELPAKRRDLRQDGNIEWLIRNVEINNDVPREYVVALAALLEGRL